MTEPSEAATRARVRVAPRLLRSRPAFAVVRALARPWYERHFERARHVGLFRGVYADFESARASAPSTKPIGCDHAGAAPVRRDALGEVSPGDYPALFWLQRLLPEIGSVYDFGGHVGRLYYALAQRVPLPEALQWVVHDVPAVLEQGRTLAALEGGRHLRFTGHLDEASDCDVFFASGSLPYVDTTLDGLLMSSHRMPRHLLVNLTPLHERHGFVTLQNVGTAFCPYRVRCRADFIASLELLGYRIVDRWSNAERRCHIPFYPEHSVRGYDGMYLRRG